MIFDYKAGDYFKYRSVKNFDNSWLLTGAEELLDRIKDINRNFNNAIEIGSQASSFLIKLNQDSVAKQKIKNFCSCGWNKQLLAKDEILISKHSSNWQLKQKSFDIVISNGILQSLNNPLDYLQGSFKLLKPDGLICGIFLGENSFATAKHALIKSEANLFNRVSPRFHPNITMVDLGRLLAKSGFVLPIIERMEFILNYKSVIRLANQIRNCGESNMLTSRRKSFSSKRLFNEWQNEIDLMISNNNKVKPFKIDAIIFIAWVPDPTQPRALKRGSARHSLEKAIKNPKI